MLSLRAQLLLGAFFWTIGLFIASMATLALVWAHVPDLPLLGRTGSIHRWVHHTATLLAIALACLVAGVFHVRRGLAGISRLRSRLTAVHEGRMARVEGRYVPEVQPLVDDLNALLEHREHAVRRALAKAGDLAHGLKTPLAVLASEADRAQSTGQADLGDAIEQQVQRMRRQINYHLAHARAAAAGAAPGATCALADSAEGLARTMRRLYAARGLSIEVRVPAQTIRVQREDLDEILGNLLDNACKWARSRVLVHAAPDGAQAVIMVDDDGLGLAPDLRERVLLRGVRADEKVPGSGLGLAIARDLAELYGGSISLDEGPLGGLRARVVLPGGWGTPLSSPPASPRPR